MQNKSGSLYSHLEDLRKMLIFSILALLGATIISYFFLLDYLMDIFLTPIGALDQQLVFIAVGEGFFTQLKLAILGGLLLSFPIVLWQILCFVTPALYSNEKRVLFCGLVASTILFILGISFAYNCLLGLGLKMFLVNFSAGFTPMVTVSSYLSFLIWFLLPFGLVFEIPVIAYFLSCLRIISPDLLISKRKYVIFGMFVLAAILTPPDIISQVLLALPMLALYELSIWISRLVFWSHKKKEIKNTNA